MPCYERIGTPLESAILTRIQTAQHSITSTHGKFSRTEKILCRTCVKPTVIKAAFWLGVDIVRQLLKDETLYILDRPENQLLIQSMRTLQRDMYTNEDKRGPKDAIQEGKHDHHAAMRYVFQSRLGWYPHEQGAKDEFVFPDLEAVY